MNDKEKRRKLISIGNKVKLAREKMGLTQEEFAKKFGYARTTLAKLEAGLRDFKATEIMSLANQLEVTCDHLLGYVPDNVSDSFKLECVNRYGLSEQALQLLERINAHQNSSVDSTELDKLKDKITNEGTPLSSDVTDEDWQIFYANKQAEFCNQALIALNDMLTVSSGKDWVTHGLLILQEVHYYCHDEQNTGKLDYGDEIPIYTYIAPEKKRSMAVYRIGEELANLRTKIKRRVRSGNNS